MTQPAEIELSKVPLPKTHVVDDNEFPVAFAFSDAAGSSPEALVAFVEQKAKEQYFDKLLAKHGAVVLRNTGATDPELVTRLVEAIGYGAGDEPFEQNGSTAKRTEITRTLTTANEGPPLLAIHQHNEFSRFKKYPTKLFFVCTRYGENTRGGETPIVHGSEFFSALQARVPGLLAELSRRGLYMAQTWTSESTTGTSWRDYFCFGRKVSVADDVRAAKEKAEAVVKATVSDVYEWTEGDNLLVHQHTKPIRNFRDPFTGREAPTLFNSLATYYHQCKLKTGNTPTNKLMYDDGEPIPEAWLEELLEASIAVSYDHAWQEGDIAIVDNYQVSHGRLPWEGGDRRVVVSMWDRPGKPEYEEWKA